jgi:hypothetical protein
MMGTQGELSGQSLVGKPEEPPTCRPGLNLWQLAPDASDDVTVDL